MTSLVTLRNPGLRKQARESKRQLARCASNGADLVVHVVGPSSAGETFALPADAVIQLHRILELLAEGQRVEIIGSEEELTTKEAADMIGVSRRYLVRLLGRGEIPFHRIGSHRRVSVSHVLEYRRRLFARREATLDELARQAHELSMGY